MSASLAFQSAIAVGSLAAFGWTVLRLFPTSDRSPWARLAAAYVLGFGLLPFALLVPALCGARLAGVTLLAPVAVAASLAIVARTRRARTSAAAPAAATTSAAPPISTASPASLGASAPTARRRALELAAIVVLLAVSALVVVLGYALPLYKFDAWAQVGFKAKVFFETRQLDGFFGRDDLLHYQNADYPLLVPLLETWVAILIGQWNEHVVKLPIALLYPALLALFCASLERYLSRTRALVATLALAAIFHFRFYATVGYADLPLAVFAFLAFDRLVGRPAPARSDVILAGLYGGLAAFAKNEGFVVIAGLALVTLARPLLRRGAATDSRAPARAIRAAARNAGVFALIALGMSVPWLAFRSAHGLSTALLSDGAAFDAARLGPLAFAIAREATDLGRWNILWPVAAASFAIAIYRRGGRGERSMREGSGVRGTIEATRDPDPTAPPSPALPAFALVAWMLLVYVGVLLASPFALDFLVATALERLLIHIVPLAVYATMLTLLAARLPTEPSR